MDVTVDGQRNFAFSREPETVLAAVSAVSDYLRGRGRAVLAVNLDGESVSAIDLTSQYGEKPTAEVGQLAITSEDIATLVQTALDELREALPELPEACHRLAEVFQSETPEDGYDPFHRLAEIWGHIKSRELAVANALNLSLEELRLEGAPLVQVHQELNEHLNEAIAALERQDCVSLGDLLEYELAPRAEQEMQIAALLQQRAHDAAG